MSRKRKIFDAVAEGKSNRNTDFEDLCNLLFWLGFQKRQRGGSHRIFSRGGVEEILNLQPEGSKAKSYQVVQVRDVIKKYRLSL